MSAPPASEDLARQLAVLEERMNTHQATYETALERIERKMAERDAEAARRETRMLLAVAGIVSLAAVVLGILIRLPG